MNKPHLKAPEVSHDWEQPNKHKPHKENMKAQEIPHYISRENIRAVPTSHFLIFLRMQGRSEQEQASQDDEEHEEPVDVAHGMKFLIDSAGLRHYADRLLMAANMVDAGLWSEERLVQELDDVWRMQRGQE